MLSNGLAETRSKYDRGPNFQVYNLKRNLIQFRPSVIQTEEFQPCQSSKMVVCETNTENVKGCPLITDLFDRLENQF